MTKKALTHSELLELPGMQYLNRSHSRTFSLNIFYMNAQELRVALDLHDRTDIMAHLMGDEHREEGHQFHREITRLLHNYLAGSMTLVDHTRVFVDENYANSDVRKEFKSRVERTFRDNPLTRFVQDLRNYMVHRGLPPTVRRLSMTKRPDTDGEVTMKADVFLNVGRLREWLGWKAEAKVFLSSAGKEIDVRKLEADYTTLIAAFHDGFDGLLREHHRDDLEFLAFMKAEFERPHFQPMRAPVA